MTAPAARRSRSSSWSSSRPGAPRGSTGSTTAGTIEVGRRADLNVIDLEHLTVRRPAVHADLPAGGQRYLQPVSGYVATVVDGVQTRAERRATRASGPAAWCAGRTSAVGIWADHVVPRIVELTMRSARSAEAPGTGALRASTGEVLEIGFGSGLTLEHYPPGVSSGACGRTVRARPAYCRAAGCCLPDSRRLHRARRAIAAVRRRVRRHGGSTFTLCTIPDVDAALRELTRVLRPGGRFHFLEHGRSDDPKIRRWQDRLNGLQSHIAGGCHLNRPIDALIERRRVRDRAPRAPVHARPGALEAVRLPVPRHRARQIVNARLSTTRLPSSVSPSISIVEFVRARHRSSVPPARRVNVRRSIAMRTDGASGGASEQHCAPSGGTADRRRRSGAHARDVEDHGRLGRRAGLLPDDVTERLRRDASDRDVGDGPVEEPGPFERLADVLVVVPAVEQPDLHEQPVRARALGGEPLAVPVLRDIARSTSSRRAVTDRNSSSSRASSHDRYVAIHCSFALPMSLRTCGASPAWLRRLRAARRAASVRCRSCARRCRGRSSPEGPSASSTARRQAVADGPTSPQHSVEQGDQGLGHARTVARRIGARLGA